MPYSIESIANDFCHTVNVRKYTSQSRKKLLYYSGKWTSDGFGVAMENNSNNGIKNAVFLCLVFLGTFIVVSFILVTLIALSVITADSAVEKGIIFALSFSFILTTFINHKRTRKPFNFRYWLSFIVFLAGIVFTVLLEGGKVMTLIDVPSLLIVGIVPFLFVSILFGFREMASAFHIQSIREADKETLKKALRFFEMYGKITFLSGVISVIIGIIYMLVHLDGNAFVPDLAGALISILYSCIIYVLIIIPRVIFIKNKLNE
jgi:hypothetical protein